MTHLLIYLLGGVLTIALLPPLFAARYRDVWADCKTDPLISAAVTVIIVAAWPCFLIVGTLIAMAGFRRGDRLS